MKKAALSLPVLLLTTLLTACPDIFVNHSDGVFSGAPLTAKADRSKAFVGEAVEVTLTAGFEVDSSSSLPEYPVSGFRLGACFIQNPRTEDASSGGFCNPDSSPLPSWIAMSGDATVVKEFDAFMIKRGDTRRFEHTFTFTATKPGRVAVSSVLQTPYPYEEEGYEYPPAHSGSRAVVIFE